MLRIHAFPHWKAGWRGSPRVRHPIRERRSEKRLPGRSKACAANSRRFRHLISTVWSIPLRAELAELAGQVRQIGTGSDGAGGPALAQRLDELAAELQTIADQGTQNAEKISGGLADLTSRLDMLEAREDALKEQFTGFAREDAQDEAAALAAIRISLLANRLRTASERGVPYADVLTALEGVAKDEPVLSGLVVRLAPHADSGVATLDALQFAFPETTVAILDNAPADAENDIVDEIFDRARRVVRVRRVGTDLPADSVDGRIARAERRLNAGDVAGAVTVLEEFEGPARAAAEPWLERARVCRSAGSPADPR